MRKPSRSSTGGKIVVKKNISATCPSKKGKKQGGKDTLTEGGEKKKPPRGEKVTEVSKGSLSQRILEGNGPCNCRDGERGRGVVNLFFYAHEERGAIGCESVRCRGT